MALATEESRVFALFGALPGFTFWSKATSPLVQKNILP
jgi:hypothetical protein